MKYRIIPPKPNRSAVIKKLKDAWFEERAKIKNNQIDKKPKADENQRN